MKHLSFKDTQFIIEAINHLIKKYEEELLAIEENEEEEDKASDLGNDYMFLESLKTELEKSLSQENTLELVPEGEFTMSKYKKPMTLEEIAQVEDSDIDFSDIPELDADFWNNAEIVQPDTTKPVTLQLKKTVV